MADKTNKKASVSQEKLRLLYVLQILKKYSDAEHTLTSGGINAYLASDFGIPEASRNTISSDIAVLIESGVDIRQKSNKYGWYFYSKNKYPLTNSDAFLLDAMISSSELDDLTKDRLRNTIHENSIQFAKEEQLTPLQLKIARLREAINNQWPIEFYYLYSGVLSYKDKNDARNTNIDNLVHYYTVSTLHAKCRPSSILNNTIEEDDDNDESISFSENKFHFRVDPYRLFFSDSHLYLICRERYTKTMLALLPENITELHLLKNKKWNQIYSGLFTDTSTAQSLCDDFLSVFYNCSESFEEFLLAYYSNKLHEIGFGFGTIKNTEAEYNINIITHLVLHCTIPFALLLNKRFNAKVCVFDMTNSGKFVEVRLQIHLTKQFMKFLRNYSVNIQEDDWCMLYEMWERRYKENKD